jgi:hypothetical protein
MCQSPDIYWNAELCSRRLMPSVIHNYSYVLVVSGWKCLKYFCMFLLYCNHQVHRDFLITLYVYKNIYIFAQNQTTSDIWILKIMNKWTGDTTSKWFKQTKGRMQTSWRRQRQLSHVIAHWWKISTINIYQGYVCILWMCPQIWSSLNLSFILSGIRSFICFTI